MQQLLTRSWWLPYVGLGQGQACLRSAGSVLNLQSCLSSGSSGLKGSPCIGVSLVPPPQADFSVLGEV